MATKEYTQFKKRSGIYYTDHIQFADESDGMEIGAIQFTTTPALIDTRIDQVSARHVKKDVVIVRGKL